MNVAAPNLDGLDPSSFRYRRIRRVGGELTYRVQSGRRETDIVVGRITERTWHAWPDWLPRYGGAYGAGGTRDEAVAVLLRRLTPEDRERALARWDPP